MSTKVQPQENYKYIILIVCCLMLGLVYMSLSSWAISLPELQAQYNLSSAHIAAGGSMLIAGYAVGSFVQGKLIGQYGWRKLFNTIMTFFVVATCLIPLVSNYFIILILRFIQGWGLIVPITNTLVCGWFPSTESSIEIEAPFIVKSIGTKGIVAISPSKHSAYQLSEEHEINQD